MTAYQKYLQSLKQIKQEKGFTLAEFFIAMAIFSFIALALFQGLSISLKVYKQQSRLDKSFTGAQLISLIMEREIQQAVYMNNIRLIGSAQQMYFYAPAVFPEIDYPVNNITYSVISDYNDTVLFQRTVKNAFALNEGESEEGTLTYSYYPEGSVSNIIFNYLTLQTKEGEEEASPQWQDSWQEDFFPDSIKVSFSHNSTSESNSDHIIILPGTWSSRHKEEEMEE